MATAVLPPRDMMAAVIIRRSVRVAVCIGVLVWVSAAAAQEPMYYCPMHPDVTATAAGACGRCGMALVAGDPFDLREYHLRVESTPPAPRVGVATRLRFTVQHPSTEGVVTNFAFVHEKAYHLFVISQDMEFYEHVHPEPQSDGSFALNVTLPRPGFYRLFSDFLPVGGAPQVIARVIATAGHAGGLRSAQARLVADRTFTKTAGDLQVRLALPSNGLIAGREETLRYEIRDSRSGAPVVDVEPYLGAFGHTLVMSSDTLHYVHAHPVEQLPETAAGAPPPQGGPALTFKALLPKPGLYRAWTQIKRRGQVETVFFTFDVGSPSTMKD